MISEQDIESVILAAVRDACEETGRPVPPDLGSETRLFGGEGLLDSLALVSMVLDVERRLSEQHGLDVSLVDDRAMSQTRSPFATVAALRGYIQQLVREG